ncbi:hypothetical protein BC826DRAFT_432359 [Russula brevipes]|nr:hypothetical protein BC826DRAFT_432359 [Russula brevipes]
MYFLSCSTCVLFVFPARLSFRSPVPVHRPVFASCSRPRLRENELIRPKINWILWYSGKKSNYLTILPPTVIPDLSEPVPVHSRSTLRTSASVGNANITVPCPSQQARTTVAENTDVNGGLSFMLPNPV